MAFLRQRGEESLGILEAHLGSRTFMVGETETIADLAVYGYTHVADEGGFSLEPYPALRALHARIAAHPRHFPITHAP
jgi:glutathione S-transferase